MDSGRRGLSNPFYRGRMAVPIRDVARSQRPRERLLALGVGTLSDAELVAVLLGTGRIGGSAVDLALELLAQAGGVAGVARSEPALLVDVAGLGPAKAARLAGAFELARRADAPVDRAPLATTQAIARVAQQALLTTRRETLLVLIADQRNTLIRTEAIATGAVDSVTFPVREVMAAVIRRDGRAFAVAHNHPSGDPTPSEFDRRASRAFDAAAEAVGLRFLDHVVVAGLRWASAT